MGDTNFTNKQVIEVSDFLQTYMLENDIDEMTADECADILSSAGILEQIPPKLGFNFRQMLRDGRDGKINMIEGASQLANSHWIIKPVMNIKVLFENCSYEKEYKFEGDAISKIVLNFEADHFPTKQSVSQKKRILQRALLTKLTRFKWLIFGDVNINFTWYFSAIKKKETTTDGDLDNLAKIILDYLQGEKGIFVDDSQLGYLNNVWFSKNEELKNNILSIEVNFNNDDCASKENLKFVQLEGSIYALTHFSSDDSEELFRTKILLHFLKKKRRTMLEFWEKSPNAAYAFASDVLFHKARLPHIDNSLVYDKDAFNELCCNAGLDYCMLLRKGRVFLKR